uniref:Enoyl reductase (ER) domain-containing protein n=1 Tax=Acrobeloides nanus TaxID=290746 RepID=A0A914C365_9BILA
MRAAIVKKFGPASNIVIEQAWPCPTISNRQVLVRVKASSVNPVDTYIRAGQYAQLPELPYTPGRDGSGIVEQIGKEVQNFKVGDSVWFTRPTTGSSAELAVVEDTLFLLPEGISYSQGAALGIAYMTAYRALILKGSAKPGQSVFIHGASGGVGIAACQIAKALGLQVVGTAGTENGIKLVEENGAEFVFNHREKDYVSKIQEKFPNGFDIILEMLANQNLDTDLTLIGKNGRIVVIGNRGTSQIDARKTMQKESMIIGVGLGFSTIEMMEKFHAQWDT